MSSQALSLSRKKIRNHLSLQKKVEVIRTAQNNPSMNVLTLGEIFKCGKTQVARILKCKDSLVTQYNANASGSRVHTSSTPSMSEFAEVNKTLYNWYILACSKNIYPAGPQLIEKAKQIAERLGKSDFTVVLDRKGKNVEEGKEVSKRQLWHFFVTAAGTKDKPVVIWRSENPRCLRRFDKSALPVDYYSQKKAWMTGRDNGVNSL